MTEEVLVTIKGLHSISDNEDEELEIVTAGRYKKLGEKHYVTYEEVVEGFEDKVQNLIKFEDHMIEVTKRGAANVHMSFERDKKNLTYYDTPYGSLLLGIVATSIDVKSREDVIDVDVRYALDINYEHMADCRLTVNIRSKNQQEVSLS